MRDTHRTLILLVGDSTVADNPPDSVQCGWGQMLRSCFAADHAEVMNFAVNGRSSKSFIAEGIWAEALAVDPPPQVVVIQLGANDIPGKRPERETLPGPVPEVWPDTGLGSRALDWYRLNLARYVAEARGIGAQAVLVASPERHEFQQASSTPTCRNRLYAQAVREVASELRVPLVDLNRYSLELFERYGVMGSLAMHVARDDGSYDHSHYNRLGASIYAEHIAGVLAEACPVLREAYHPSTLQSESRLVMDRRVMDAVVGKA